MKSNRELFIEAIENGDKKLDSFARTFLRKADMQDLWDKAIFVASDGDVRAAIITTHSKAEPKIANLQLLHTFSKHRGGGYAKQLCLYELHNAIYSGCEYFRVSAEPSAIKFYEKIGFTFLGEQKSKCQLSMFKINQEMPTFAGGIYDINDPIIKKAIYKKGKGGCVKIF
jgi:ribosomal protein S18 acetylase RimI-like enzyme